jgi:hypothetical protein
MTIRENGERADYSRAESALWLGHSVRSWSKDLAICHKLFAIERVKLAGH